MTPIEAFNNRYDPLRFDQAASEVTDAWMAAWMAAWTISSAITEGIMADMMLKDEALLQRALDTLAYWLEHGETPGAHDMIQRTHDALQERLIPLGVGKGVGKREHITDGSPCWCNPETTYTDPDTGVSVIVHKEPQ